MLVYQRVPFQHPTDRMRLGIAGRGQGHPRALHQALQVRKPRHRQADAVLGWHGEMIWGDEMGMTSEKYRIEIYK